MVDDDDDDDDDDDGTLYTLTGDASEQCHYFQLVLGSKFTRTS